MCRLPQSWTSRCSAGRCGVEGLRGDAGEPFAAGIEVGAVEAFEEDFDGGHHLAAEGVGDFFEMGEGFVEEAGKAFPRGAGEALPAQEGDEGSQGFVFLEPQAGVPGGGAGKGACGSGVDEDPLFAV